MFQRKRFSVRRNATKRWKYAVGGQDDKVTEELSVVIHSTTFDLDMQKFAVEVANQGLDSFRLESELASWIKSKFEENTAGTWHVIVGKNFGAGISAQRYIHFRAAKIIIMIYQT
ncbi:Dynein light chain [Aphelenchoides besseyi]|nr:Dynein light chain [Aphelenchoides besseyi]KAI6200761.1 Dynein light chain [Aphelenchoides besseyi]